MTLVLILMRSIRDEIDNYARMFEAEGIKTDIIIPTQGLSEDELVAIISKYDGVIAGDDEFTRKVFEKAKKLKVISKWGTGMDGIDLEAAKDFGVKVFNSAGNLKYPVAEFVIGLMLCLARGIPELNKNMKEGRWEKREGVLLKDKTLGVVGIGRIGKEILTRAKAFGMNLIGYDVMKVDFEDVEMTTLEDLLKRSDFISINCPLTPKTRKMIGEKEFALMKASAFLINTARGAIIDEEALIHALKTNHIRGAALDVFENEPLPKNSPLRKMNNCILTPHNAFWAGATVKEINDIAVQNLFRGLKAWWMASFTRRYFSEDCDEKEMIEYLPELLKSCKIFVDIGASFGQYAFYANKIMHNGQIYAYEPDTQRFIELQTNCRRWESLSTNKINVFPYAISYKDGKVTFYSSGGSISGTFFKYRKLSWKEIIVDCYKLDTLFKDKIPDVVKIDVEGTELRVLRGATKILSKGKTIFLIELHQGIDPKGQKCKRDVFDFLRKFGYKVMGKYSRVLVFKRKT